MRNNFVKFQKFLTIFVKTVVLFTIFYTLEKTVFSFFNMKEGYSKKCKTKKKHKEKIITKPIKRNYKEDCKSIIKTFLKMKKLKKEILWTLEKK